MTPPDSGVASRARILEAAARAYNELGFRGATTRHIAEQAGVNEVTVFRQFGSKAALLDEAIRCQVALAALNTLPAEPRDPHAELTAWSRAYLEHLRNARSFIRRMMGEIEERPEMGACAANFPRRAARELGAYFTRLKLARLIATDRDVTAASAMLRGTLFADAMGRDMMPELFPQPVAAAPGIYTRLLLDSLGCRPGHRSHSRSKPAPRDELAPRHAVKTGPHAARKKSR